MTSTQGKLSKETLVVLNKLKKHPCYGRDEAELSRLAESLSDPEYIRCQFSYLLDSIDHMVTRAGREEEEEQALQKSVSLLETTRRNETTSLANAMNIPVKLILKKLNHATPLANKLSHLIRCEYGPLHTILQVGEVTLEWGNEELVIPTMEPILPGDLETRVPEQSEWYKKTKRLTRALDVAQRKRDHVEKFEVVFKSMGEKVQMINKLVDVIISYNCEKTYSIFKCNCQHFTHDALSVLGYRDPIQFSGKMDDYFKQLKAGKLTVPEEYSTHKNLDDYVKENLDHLSIPDMEYLICQYFKHHLPSMKIGDDDWQCDIDGCQCEILDSQVKNNSSFMAMQRWELSLESSTEMEQGMFLEQLPDEFQGVSFENQEDILKKIKGGYRAKVLHKVQHHPNKTLSREDNIVDNLTETERFRENFCTDIIEGVSEALVVETSADSQMADITTEEARCRVEKRMKVFCSFPVKLLLYRAKRKSAHITTALQVGGYYFEWNRTNLIIPKRVDELIATRPVLKVAVSQEGEWSSYLKAHEHGISHALKRLDYDALIQLQYQLMHKKDELLCALIDTIVHYNRNNAYNFRKCNSTQFLREAQLVLGIEHPNKVTGAREYHKTVKEAWKKLTPEKVQIKTHQDLDKYAELQREHVVQEVLDYCIDLYFTLHVSKWEGDREEPGKEWSCSKDCKLPIVEQLVDLCMW